MNLFKKLLTLVMCVLIVASLGACGGGSTNDDGGDGNTITLRVQSAAPLRFNYNSLLKQEEEGSMLYNQALFTKRFVEGFKALYPNVNLNLIEDGWGDALYQQQQLYIRDYMNGGSMAVDIMIGETYMGYFAENNLFARLDKTKFANVLESVYADTVVNGDMFCVPMCTGIMGLQYNTEILAEAGIPEEEWVPATWDELYENSKKVNDFAIANNKKYGGIMMNNVAGIPGAFRALPFMRQAGGDILDENGELVLDSEENLEAFTYLRKLATTAYEDSLTSDSEDTLQYYFTEKGYAAYMVEGQWSMANAPDYIKAAPLPQKDEESTVNGNVNIGCVLFGVTEGSKNKEIASKFLEYLTSTEVQNWFYELDGRLPVNKEVLESEEIRTVHPNINPYIDALLAGGFEGGLPCFIVNSNDIWYTKWANFYKEILTTNKEIPALLTAVQSAISSQMN